MIYELVQFIQESILQYNSPPSITSLHDEMIRRQKSSIQVESADAEDLTISPITKTSSHDHSTLISTSLNDSIDELSSQDEFGESKRGKASAKEIMKVRGNDRIGEMIAEELKRQQALKLSSDSFVPLTSSTSSINSSSGNSIPSDIKSPHVQNKEEEESKKNENAQSHVSKEKKEDLDSSSGSIGNNSSQEIPKPISEGTVIHPNITHFGIKWQRKGDVTEINKFAGVEIKARLLTAINSTSAKPMIIKEFAIYVSNSPATREKIIRVAQSIHQLHTMTHVNILNYIGCQVDECDTSYLFRIFQGFHFVMDSHI